MVEHNINTTKRTYVNKRINAELKNVRELQKKIEMPRIGGSATNYFMQEIVNDREEESKTISLFNQLGMSSGLPVGSPMGLVRSMKILSMPFADVVKIYIAERNANYHVRTMGVREFLDFANDIMQRNDEHVMVDEKDNFEYGRGVDMYGWTLSYYNARLMRVETRMEFVGKKMRISVLMLMCGIAMTMRHDVWNAYTYIPRELSSWIISDEKKETFLILSILYWNGRAFRNAFLGEDNEESIAIKPYNFSLQQLRAFAMGMSDDGEELLISRVNGKMLIRPYTEMVARWDDMFTSTWMKLEPTT